MFSEQRYLEAIAVLTYIYDTNPTSRNNMTSSHTKYFKYFTVNPAVPSWFTEYLGSDGIRTGNSIH